MLKNRTDEDYLKGYAVKLSALLWTGEENWNEQKNKATQFVFNDLIQRGYDIRQLMPELVLRSSSNSISATANSDGVEDTINRLRLVLENISVTNSSVLLQGSNDNSNWNTITTIALTSTSNTSTSELFFDTYKYYRIRTEVASGTADFQASLVETVYDPLFACKWLVFIFSDLRKSEGDQFDLRMKFYEEQYSQIMNSVKIYIDTNSDGIPDSFSRTGTIQFIR